MFSHRIDRRGFLTSSMAAGAAAALSADHFAARAAEAPADASRLIAGKDPRLIVYGADPLEIETPLSLLREHAITPKKILFVRNNQMLTGAATLKPIDDPTWKVDFTGMLQTPASISVGELRGMEQIERELVLQCSGNGRASFSRAAPAKGAQWGNGAMANVVFKGVPLIAVIERLKLKVSPDARFLTAEGKDTPAKMGEADFEHGIPLGDALTRSILALELNGESIPALHGGPLRLVTPGYYATMNVKWLSRLRFEALETENYHQVRRYRTPREPIKPGSAFTYDLSNSDANWRMRTKSVIFSPLDGEQVAAGAIEVRGVAFNDGAVDLDSVDVSCDDGRTWRRAELTKCKSPFGWAKFRAVAKLQPGTVRIAARAIDRLGRAQPWDGQIGWNPAGYAWNGVHVVTVRVTG